MDLERQTPKAQQAILDAQQRAMDSRHSSVEPAHLLLALLHQAEGVAPAIAARIAGSPAMLVEELERDLAGRPRVYGGSGRPGLSRAAADALTAAERQASSMKDGYVSTEHVLLALSAGPEAARLKAYGVTPEAVLQAMAGISPSWLARASLTR